MVKEYTAVNPAENSGSDGVFNRSVPLAMAYVRDQSWESPMTACDALSCGTAFRSLVMPFRGEDDA